MLNLISCLIMQMNEVPFGNVIHLVQRSVPLKAQDDSFQQFLDGS